LESYWGTTQADALLNLTASPASMGVSGVASTDDNFDVVLFGLSIGSVPLVASELVQANSRWQAAVTTVKTVATQALQLWLTEPPETLGGGWTRDSIVGGYVEPFDTWADMEPLSGQENVPDAKTVAYFCNVLPDTPAPARPDPDWVAAQEDLVRANSMRFVARDLAVLWPEFGGPGGPRWDWLAAPAGVVGLDRLGAQFFRANVEPSERYVLSVPGSSRHRIPPDDTGFTNLFVAGDWTECKLNAGCVEAAVMSGLRAANAINERFGGPTVEIIGWDEP